MRKGSRVKEKSKKKLKKRFTLTVFLTVHMLLLVMTQNKKISKNKKRRGDVL